jgi:hypothetical protein
MHLPAIELHRLVILIHRPAIELHRLVILMHRPAIELHRPAIELHRPAIELHRPAIELHRLIILNITKIHKYLGARHQKTFGKTGNSWVPCPDDIYR